MVSCLVVLLTFVFYNVASGVALCVTTLPLMYVPRDLVKEIFCPALNVGLGGLLISGSGHSTSFAGLFSQLCSHKLFPCLLVRWLTRCSFSSIIQDIPG